MPLYDVQCSACGYRSEEFQKMDAKQPTRCPECRKTRVRRVFTKAPATLDTYPDGHPRKNRGRG